MQSFEDAVAVGAGSAFVPLARGVRPDTPAFRPFDAAAEPAPAAADAPAPAEEPAAASDARASFQAGYEQARRDLEGESASMRDAFLRSLEELVAFRTRLRERYERELLQVALGVARKVVQQELAERPEIWLTMIRAAVHRTVGREHIVVRVPEQLAAFLRQSAPMLEDVKDLEIVADGSLPAGGCLVESRLAEVDIGIDTQLEAARNALLRSEE